MSVYRVFSVGEPNIATVAHGGSASISAYCYVRHIAAAPLGVALNQSNLRESFRGQNVSYISVSGDHLIKIMLFLLVYFLILSLPDLHRQLGVYNIR